MHTDPIDILAADLALNSIDTSTINNIENREAIKLLLSKDIFEKRYPKKGVVPTSKRTRNILVIGAGPSKDVNRNIPTAANIVGHFLKNADSNEEIKKLKEKYKYLERVYDLSSHEFETTLKVLSEIKDEKFVRKELKKLVGYKYMPSQFYEIVGHMFKHRMIDVIINFNFDEILDNIIEEEMGQSEYHKIFLDGHAPDSYQELLIEGKLRIPIYIKPHGTISHLASLRFTRQQYWDAPERVRALMVELFSKNYRDGSIDMPLAVNVISVGYSYNDFDLADTLLDAFEKNDASNTSKKFRFFVFDRKNLIDFKNGSKHFSKIIEKTRAKDEVYHIDGPIGDSFLKLFSQIQTKFNSDIGCVLPRGIARHKLVAELFHRPDGVTYRYVSEEELDELAVHEREKFRIENDTFRKYLEKRIVLELAIVIGKSGGVVHMTQIENSRAGFYCNLYLKYYRKMGDYKCLYSFIKKFTCLKHHMDALLNTFTVENDFLHDGKIKFEEIFEIVWNSLEDDELDKDSCLDLFKQACSGNLSSINPDFRKFRLSIFEGIEEKNLLYSDTRWFFALRSIFEKRHPNTKWNTLLAVTETGNLLLKPYYFDKLINENSKVALILADYKEGKVPKNTDQLKKLPTIEKGIRFFPWWMHNKHMFIFMNMEENGKIRFCNSIYYNRRSLTNVVNPLLLDTEKDVAKLFKLFSNYWTRSGRYMNNVSSKGTTTEQLKLGETTLLGHIYRSHFPDKQVPRKFLTSFGEGQI